MLYNNVKYIRKANFFMNRIKDARIEKGIKQADLAEILNVSQGTLSNWERGEHDPDIESLLKISSILKKTTDYLLGHDLLILEKSVNDNPLNEEHKKLINLYQLASSKMQRAIMDILEDVTNPASTSMDIKTNIEKEYKN